MENIEDIVESMPKIIGGRYRLNILIKNFDTDWSCGYYSNYHGSYLVLGGEALYADRKTFKDAILALNELVNKYKDRIEELNNKGL